MIRLHRDPHSGWRYTQDERYAITKTHGAHVWWDVRELSEDGTYRLINSFHTLKGAREYLEQLPIYNAPMDGV